MSAGLSVDGLVLIGAALLAVGVLVVGVSDRLRVPASLLSLGLGMVAGSDISGWLYLDDMELVRNLSVLALIVILFEGGLTTRPTVLRESAVAGSVLATLGVVVSAVVTGLGARLILDVEWEIALLLGAVVASTDAAVVFDLLRRAPLTRRIGGILEVESGLNDPVAILLTVGLIETIRSDSVGAADWLAFGAVQLLGGLVVGAVLGWMTVRLLALSLRAATLYPVLALAGAGVTYAVAALFGASGFLAVYVAGLIIGGSSPRHLTGIRGFSASLANGAGVILFLLLGLLVFPSDLVEVAWAALAVAAILIVVARPMAVWLSTIGFGLTPSEKAVLSWGGLRGAVPIVLATFPATAGLDSDGLIFNIVFFVVLTSMLIQGSTVVALAGRLGQTEHRPAWESIADSLPLDGTSLDLVEVHINEDLAISGARLRDMPPGEGMMVTVLVRDDKTTVVSGETVFEPDDVVVLAVDRTKAQLTDVTAWARGE